MPRDRTKDRALYRATHREEILASQREYRITHPEVGAIYRAAHRDEKKAYYESHRDEINAKLRKKYADSPEIQAAYRAAHREERVGQERMFRLGVLQHYGGKCACCGETVYEFLTFDHINNDGAEHRKIIGKTRIARWLKKNNYPDGFQVLCANCNHAKGHYGHCPHQIQKAGEES